MPYAIIRTGGTQYRVTEGLTLRLEYFAGEAGSEVQLGGLIALGEGDSLNLDASSLEGKTIAAKVIRQGRGKKIHIWKSKRRQGYEKRQGHRQDFTEVRILSLPA